jgi:hypothetical protein
MGTGLSYTVTGADAESGVTRIDLYGQFNYRCALAGDPTDPGTDASVDATGTPFATGQGGELTSTGPGTVSFAGSVTLCPAGQEVVPPFFLDAWAVVWNGAGFTFTTDHATLAT